MKNPYVHCQSCGMPLKKDIEFGGTNADGSLSKMYCSNCYESGKFRQPNWSAVQMRDFAIDRLKEKGVPGFLARFFTRHIPELIRWKGNKAQQGNYSAG